MSKHEATELVPILSGDWLGGAVYDPSWKSIDVHELLMVSSEVFARTEGRS